MMKIHLANFGLKNYLWPTCRERSTIAMTEDRDLREYRARGDRAGYIAFALANKKSTTGSPLTKGTASRWYGLPNIFAESVGDIWLHREKDELWWSVSKSDPATTTLGASTNLYVMHKPVEPWSNKNRKGARLLWSAIHPMARNFLWNRGTTVQLTSDNVAYTQALIDGDDLAPWHTRKDWKKAVEDSGKGLATVQDVVARAAMQMAYTAMGTAKSSNGQEVTRTLKNKEVLFANTSVFADYIRELLLEQEEACAITSLPLQYEGQADDPEMICSLDRIDSNGHYEAGNLQVVCRFVNRWKSDSDDDQFRRLIRLLQSSEPSA
ncbi:hypothetical protein [Burkholderia metallica]|uniref:hypothetical protein n=1 Tax=Burkholderia cepacia complex TaxID=87882 RepID=UPI00145304B6|nr:hypothetical protein [Burkholderia metallica]VWC26501.1 hypothetical protein BME24068_06128 [Burkholderia metallica]